MDRLYEWVDANPPSPNRRFSMRRVAKLFVAIVASSILGALPLAVWNVCVQSSKHERNEREQQEQLRRQMSDLEEAAKRGETGEATRRLFGIGTSRQTAGMRPLNNPTEPGRAKE